MASPLPLSSLRLLVPPLRLLTAAMWRVARHQAVRHYGMLEDFVALVTEAVPKLLTDRQRSLLLLALRVKVTLSEPDPQADHTHLDPAQLVPQDTTDVELGGCLQTLSTLTDRGPADRRRLLQDVFDHSFDSALQSLICNFLSRIEELFPVPDFKQAAAWLDAAPAGVDDCLQEADREELRELLTNQSDLQGPAAVPSGPGDVSAISENILLSAWSHPLLSGPASPEPPPADADQSELDVELVKVEVVVMTEDEPVPVEETVIGQSVLVVDREASNQSPAVSDVTAEVVESERIKDSPDQSEATAETRPRRRDRAASRVSQSDQTCSEVTANALYSISHNSQRVAHRCPQCGKCFIYRSQVIRHLRTNRSCAAAANLQTQPEQEPRPPELRPPEPRPPRAHSCFQCSAVFKTKAELLSHQRSHRARPIYQCGQCHKAFHHLSSLSNHKQTHLDKDGFTGGRCDEASQSARDRDAHRLRHRLPELSCTVCEQAFGSQTQLLRHLQTHSVEGAEPRYNCRFCDQTFTGVTQLRIHQRTHTCRSYQCDQCSKTYGSLAGLQAHRAGHGAESRFLCPQCGKRFKTRDGLEGHLRTHTGERPYRCPYCPKDFTALAGLNVHVRRHTGERPYVCTVCGKGWPSGGDLQKHMRTHTGERPYVCQDCGKAFSISCHLTEHRRIHTGEKPFSCPECGKCLRRKFDLKKHMLSHSSVRPYACALCPKSYTRKTHLNRHLLSHRAANGDQAAAETAADA